MIVCWGVSRVKERGPMVFCFCFCFLCVSRAGPYQYMEDLMGAARDFQFGIRLRWQHSAHLSSGRNGIGP